MTVPKALTIAGSDSGGGAGIQADLKTFSAFQVFGSSVLTAITAQNSVGVHGVHELPPAFVRAQLDAVLSDFGAGAVKIGMLASPPIIDAVAEGLAAHAHGPIVLDPVMIPKSGDPLLWPDAREALAKRLLPLAAVVTPNLHEASALAGMSVTTEREMEEAARRIHAFGPRCGRAPPFRRAVVRGEGARRRHGVVHGAPGRAAHDHHAQSLLPARRSQLRSWSDLLESEQSKWFA